METAVLLLGYVLRASCQIYAYRQIGDSLGEVHAVWGKARLKSVLPFLPESVHIGGWGCERVAEMGIVTYSSAIIAYRR